MTKTLRNLAFTGASLASLALVGCGPTKIPTLHGTFRGYDVEIKGEQENPRNPRRVIISSMSHIITGYNEGGSFNEIYLDYTKVNTKSPQPDLRGNPLFRYSNQRSLRAAYREALAENGRTIK